MRWLRWSRVCSTRGRSLLGVDKIRTSDGTMHVYYAYRQTKMPLHLQERTELLTPLNIRLNIAVPVRSLTKRKPKKIGDVRSPARQQCHRRWQKSELADRSICNNLYSVIAMDTCNTTKCRCTSNFGKQILIASPHEEKKIL